MRFEQFNFKHKNKTASHNNRGSFFPQVLNLLTARASAGTIIQMEKTLCRHKRDVFNRFLNSQRYFFVNFLKQ